MHLTAVTPTTSHPLETLEEEPLHYRVYLVYTVLVIIYLNCDLLNFGKLLILVSLVYLHDSKLQKKDIPQHNEDEPDDEGKYIEDDEKKFNHYCAQSSGHILLPIDEYNLKLNKCQHNLARRPHLNVNVDRKGSPLSPNDYKQSNSLNAGKDEETIDDNMLTESSAYQFMGKFKLKERHNEVYFSEVSTRHPSQINTIPWRHLNMEWWRLHTFSNYPRNSPCSAILLARQGFVYIGKGDPDDDTVICAFCFSAVKNLDKSVNIDDLHRNLNSDCPFVRNSCSNVLIQERGGNSISAILSELQRLDEKLLKSSYSSPSCNKPSDSSDQFNNCQTQSVEIDGCQTTPSSTAVPSARSQSTEKDVRQTAAGPISNETQKDSRQASGSNDTPVLVTNHTPNFSPLGQNTTSGSPNTLSDNGHSNSTLQSDSVAVSTTLPNPVSSRNSSIASANSQQSGGNSTVSRPPQQQGGGQSQAQTVSDNSSNIQNSQTQSDSSQATTTTSYDKLGIITARPKRHEYAVEVTRLQTFDQWPPKHHIKPTDLAKAGYFYSGFSDCARCFYCGGGLRNWEEGDDVWVEHARWFPKCPFMRQCVGQAFIDVVQHLNKEREMIPYKDVIDEMRKQGLDHTIPKDVKDRSIEIERDAAVRTIVDNGFSEADVLRVAEKLRELGTSLASDLIYDELSKRGITRTSAIKKGEESQSISKKGYSKHDKEAVESLKGENNQLRQQSQCKICMDKEVSVVFLPCGHFVSCNDCSFALKSCPVCRDSIKGVVRAFLN